MATEAIFTVFEDFNERQGEPSLSFVEAVSLPLGDVREEAWTDGYLTARQERGTRSDDPGLTAKLMTSVFELDGKAAEAVEAASLAVADLLVNTVISMTSDEWSAQLMDRVRLVADHIKAALTVAPEFVLRDDCGTLHRFGDISSLSRAIEAGNFGEEVSIRWQRGEATICRSALLEDLRQAIIPLSAGLVNEQNVRYQP
jgi:hypothetical protein